jgi:hypothetical protein
LAAKSALPTTRVAAASLMPAELPAVTTAPGNFRVQDFEPSQHLGRGVARMLVGAEHAFAVVDWDGDDLVVKVPLGDGVERALL